MDSPKVSNTYPNSQTLILRSRLASNPNPELAPSPSLPFSSLVYSTLLSFSVHSPPNCENEHNSCDEYKNKKGGKEKSNNVKEASEQ